MSWKKHFIAYKPNPFRVKDCLRWKGQEKYLRTLTMDYSQPNCNLNLQWFHIVLNCCFKILKQQNLMCYYTLSFCSLLCRHHLCVCAKSKYQSHSRHFFWLCVLFFFFHPSAKAALSPQDSDFCNLKILKLF